MKIIKGVLALILVAALLLGCAPKDEQPADTNDPGESATGGVASSADKINVNDIDIVLDGEDTVVTISMISGSREAGYSESKLVNLPVYEVVQLTQPQRLMVTLQSISFWDFKDDASQEDWALSDFLLGVFYEVPSNSDSLILYIQLSKNAEFEVQEADGELILRLTQGSENEIDPYYCLADAFYEHKEGAWPDSIDMQPVLCTDGENKLLISQPFETQEEAESFMENANDILREELQNASVYVKQINKDGLPDYANESDAVSPEQSVIVIRDGEEVDTQVLLEDGRFLAVSEADKSIAFSRKYKPQDPALEEDKYLYSDKLYILDQGGRVTSIDDSIFYGITKAEFSADGRYLGILDESIENRVLYIYDFQTETLLYNLGEEGFGNQTATFAWSDTGNTLYAMTGYGDMQLMSATMEDNGELTIEAIEEQAGSEGVIAVSQGRVFFADKMEDNGIIYQIGETRNKITDGTDLKVSPDGRTMLVLEAETSEGEQVICSLKIHDIETGEETYITENAEIVNFEFVQNGGKVCYIDAAIEEAEGDYLYGIYLYDIVSSTKELIGLSLTNEFAKGTQESEIYLIDNAGDTEMSTYIYDLSE